MKKMLLKVDAYFMNHPSLRNWFGSDETTRSNAVSYAMKVLAPYKNRVNSTFYLYAIAEQALWSTQSDSRSDLQRAGVTGYSMGSLSEQFSLQDRLPHIAPQAWAFLQGNPVKMGLLR